MLRLHDQDAVAARLGIDDADVMMTDVATAARHIAWAIDEAIAETGASSMKDMGTVIKAVMARTAGQAEGGVVSAKVKERLGA